MAMEVSYHSEDIQTQHTTVKSGIDLNVSMDAVDIWPDPAEKLPGGMGTMVTSPIRIMAEEKY
jgi:hypothetical protein